MGTSQIEETEFWLWPRLNRPKIVCASLSSGKIGHGPDRIGRKLGMSQTEIRFEPERTELK